MRHKKKAYGAPLLLALAPAAAGWISYQESGQERPIFTDITAEVGLDFFHEPGAEGNYVFPEIMGSGAAFLDYDNDGDLDIYLIQGGGLPESNADSRKPNRLFQQGADGTLTDVTTESGLGDRGYGTGVAVGDIDSDGFVDVYVANVGADALYRNEGGRFSNITERAGIRGEAYSASATFCDYDRDGFLDLYVTHYVTYDPARECLAPDGKPDYCSPQSYSGASDVLYHNDGDGTFTDVSAIAGITEVAAPGLGVICSDFNRDGWPDFYVANDGTANQLWENQGNGKFVDKAFFHGVAFSGMGQAEAGMGVAMGDADGDRDLEVFVTNLKDQTNTLYVNDGKWGFRDGTDAAGLAAPSLHRTGFGTGFFDFDDDGDLDIAVANGRVYREAPLEGAGVSAFWKPYAEPNLLMENDGSGRFRDVSELAGSFSSDVEVSRALAFGDFDKDGDLDLLLTHTGGPARLFRNDAAKRGSWLLVRALEVGRRRDSHGAEITVTAAEREYVRVANPGFGYLSSNDPRAHFGIVGSDTAESIRVRWPDGTLEDFPGVALNQSIVVEKGTGKKTP
ncbi:MAG: CRTAC1 family protein [Vicinamibacteria bacterium]